MYFLWLLTLRIKVFAVKTTKAAVILHSGLCHSVNAEFDTILWIEAHR